MEKAITVHIRVSRDEAKAIRKVAKQEGRSVSNWLRLIAMRAANGDKK